MASKWLAGREHPQCGDSRPKQDAFTILLRMACNLKLVCFENFPRSIFRLCRPWVIETLKSETTDKGKLKCTFMQHCSPLSQALKLFSSVCVDMVHGSVQVKSIGSLLDNRHKISVLTHCLFLYSSCHVMRLNVLTYACGGFWLLFCHCCQVTLLFTKASAVTQWPRTLSMNASLCICVIFYWCSVLSRALLFTPFSLCVSDSFIL